jgi:hypothetical protein
MTVDDASIPIGKPLKVRCPHCKGIGLVERQQVPRDAMPHTARPRSGSGEQVPPRQKSPVSPSRGRQVFEVSLPADAFKDFRFPSEEVEQRRATSEPRLRRKVIWMIGASLGTILFFAALVNIILRGPAR